MRRVLVANRGEIACRVIRGCRELGLATIAVYSEPDANAPHVRLADEAVALGPAAPAESYLNAKKIIAAARSSRADAIHPGYGFLSENGDFAAAVEEAGLIFIGPSAETIRQMGDKSAAKLLMQVADVPVIPGQDGIVEDNFATVAEKIGFPLLVKAAAGGGGKGMRVVADADGLEAAVEAARHEAEAAFGDGRLLLERYINRPRHIEVQILADNKGHTVHLGERECSVQRRHQKVIEEAPSPALTPELREQMGAVAVAAAKAVGYRNAGTVEFLFQDGEFWFLEMNTRLQVEHGVTELAYGVDLVKWQLRIAAGEPLTLRQEDIAPRGHAIECRVYAEDPARNFLPSPGRIRRLREPAGPGIRVDSGIVEGQEIGSDYDPLLAKLLVHDATRADALDRMAQALCDYVILGPTTNIAHLEALLRHDAFRAGELDTHFIETHFADWAPAPPSLEALVAAGATRSGSGRPPTTAAGRDPWSPWGGQSGWRQGV